jgi:Fur family iron response transcriptional regulator
MQRLSPEQISALLIAHDIRPTRQRLTLAACLFAGPHRHVTAEALHREVQAEGHTVSLATVYNTLNHLLTLGLLREVTLTSGSTWFDTNTDHHFHAFHEETGELWDIDPAWLGDVPVAGLPEGTELSRLDVVLRVRSKHP